MNNVTSLELAYEYVDLANKFIGAEEGDSQHAAIIAAYNMISPLPRGHRMSMTEPWCAAFVSAVAWLQGITAPFPFECSCSKMIELSKASGMWRDKNTQQFAIGDIVFFDWEGDGHPDHCGIIMEIKQKSFATIEGNKNDRVQKSIYPIGDKRIFGFSHLNWYKIFPTVPDEELDLVVNEGLFLGDGKGNFHWDSKASRADLARLVARLLEKLRNG